MSKKLYHETHPRTATKIANEGFKSSNSQKATPNTNGNLYIPRQDASFELSGEYFKLVNFMLDKLRPTSYPQRGSSIWFYNYEPTTSPLDRDSYLVCDAEQIFNLTTEPLVAVPFSIADELFMGELKKQFTGHQQLEKDVLHQKIEEYWDSAQTIQSPSEIPTDQLYEVYVPQENLPSDIIIESREY
jgi:hypothetical protein